MGVVSFLRGFGLGAGVMYFADPDRGRRRRALVRDQFRHTSHTIADNLDAMTTDFSNRAAGLAAEAKAMLSCGAAPDDLIIARVRSRLGHLVSRPRDVQVTALFGRVTLQGTASPGEIAGLLAATALIPGVTSVENRLQSLSAAGDGITTPAYGATAPAGTHPAIQWTPADRLLVSAAGSAVMLSGLRRRGMLGAVMSTAGAGMLCGGILGQELYRAGKGDPHTVVFDKTVTIDAPLDQVFRYFDDYAHFPNFMAFVREVTDLGNGRSHWVVSGPAGVPIEWDAMVTEREQESRIAWRSAPGAAVENSGRIRFEPDGETRTRVSMHVAYRPPAGRLGHELAALFGADAKSEMDADIARLKTFLETGTRAHDAAEHKSRDVAAMGDE